MQGIDKTLVMLEDFIDYIVVRVYLDICLMPDCLLFIRKHTQAHLSTDSAVNLRVLTCNGRPGDFPLK